MSKMNPKISILFVTIFVVAMTRLLPHWPNFTAVGAIAIFGGATIRNSWKAVLIPLAAIFISDLLINNIFYSAYYDGFVFFGQASGWIYGAFILMTVMAHISIKSFKALPIVGTAVSGSVLFYALTNLGAWIGNPLYTADASGLLMAYEAGLPFLLNSMFANVLFSGVLFGTYYVALEKKVEWLFVK